MTTPGANTLAVRRYKAANREILRERRRDRYTDEAKTTRLRKSNPKTWGATVLPNIRFRAKKNGLECTITSADLIVPDVCPVFGTPFEFATDNLTRSNPNTPSVDRVDNTKGYVPENIRIISLRANQLKSNASIEEIECILAYMKKELLN